MLSSVIKKGLINSKLNNVLVLNNSFLFNSKSSSLNGLVNCHRAMSILSKRGTQGVKVGGQQPNGVRESARVRRDIIRKQSKLVDKNSTEYRLSQHLQEQEQQFSKNTPTTTNSGISIKKKQQKKSDDDEEGQEENANLSETSLQTVIGSTNDEELMYRLMINELNSERKYNEMIHQLIVELPEWQDYNNEVLRALKQIEIDFHAYTGPSSWISYDHFEKRRIREVEQIRSKHFKRVSMAVDARLEEYSGELDQEIQQKIESIMTDKNLTESEMRNSKEYAYLFEDDNIANEQQQQLAIAGEEKDEFDLAIERALGAENSMLDTQQIPEEVRMLYHKTMGTKYKRKDIEIEHSFEMEPMNDLTYKNLDDSDFNLKDILNSMSSDKNKK